MNSQWPPQTPYLTVDMIIRTGPGLVLIKRKYEPLGWALPGGFVEVGETVEQAACREAFEETGLQVQEVKMVGVYSDPARDPRFHTVSVVFAGSASETPVGGDDAAEARSFPVTELPDNIVFDHRTIIDDFLKAEETSRK